MVVLWNVEAWRTSERFRARGPGRERACGRDRHEETSNGCFLLVGHFALSKGFVTLRAWGDSLRREYPRISAVPLLAIWNPISKVCSLNGRPTNGKSLSRTRSRLLIVQREPISARGRTDRAAASRYLRELRRANEPTTSCLVACCKTYRRVRARGLNFVKFSNHHRLRSSKFTH